MLELVTRATKAKPTRIIAKPTRIILTVCMSISILLLTPVAVFADTNPDDAFDAAVEGANQLTEGYYNLREDIEVTYPEYISDKEGKIEEQSNYVAELEETIREKEEKGEGVDTLLEQELKQAKSRLNRYNTELDRLNSELEMKESQVDDYELGLKQRQDEALSSDINWGTSVNSDYEGIENYDRDVIEYTNRFWVEDEGVITACYRYWEDRYNNWVWIPFISPNIHLELYTVDGRFVSALTRDETRDRDYEKKYSLCSWTGTDIHLTEPTYILKVNGVDYYIGKRPDNAGESTAQR